MLCSWYCGSLVEWNGGSTGKPQMVVDSYFIPTAFLQKKYLTPIVESNPGSTWFFFNPSFVLSNGVLLFCFWPYVGVQYLIAVLCWGLLQYIVHCPVPVSCAKFILTRIPFRTLKRLLKSISIACQCWPITFQVSFNSCWQNLFFFFIYFLCCPLLNIMLHTSGIFKQVRLLFFPWLIEFQYTVYIQYVYTLFVRICLVVAEIFPQQELLWKGLNFSAND